MKITKQQILLKYRYRVHSKAWIISVLFHTLLLGSLAAITFTHDKGLGTTESDIGIYDINRDTAISREAQTSPSFELSDDALTNTKTETISISKLDPSFPAQKEKGDTNSIAVTKEILGQISTTDKDSWRELVNDNSNAGDGNLGASFFGIADRGKKFIYILDCSGSMDGERLIAAKSELTRSIRKLKKGSKFEIFFYNDAQQSFNGGSLKTSNKKNIRMACRWIEKIKASGGTNPMSAVKAAISLEPDCIWILSDGEFHKSVSREIERLNRSNIHIHTIAFMSDGSNSELREIAKRNNGKFRSINKRTKRKR